MKKVALAINYDYHDYGGMLQAFATQRFLEKHGVESDAINFDNLKGDIKRRKMLYFLRNITDISIVKEKSKLVEKKVRQNLDGVLGREMQERNAAFDLFCKTHFKVSRAFSSWDELADASEKEYQAVMVGSDQLWLPSNVLADYYTLSWVPAHVRKIAYATSFGIDNIPAAYKSKYSQYLNRFDYLSARETSGQKIIKEMTDRDVRLVCDPALLLDETGWNEIVMKDPIVKEQYVFCYFMGDNPVQREFVKKLAKNKGLKVVALLHLDQYIASDEEYADYTPWNVSPADFVNLVKNAECVCTDSFHGTVFSIIYSRPFYTFKRFNKKESLSTNGRIISLLGRLNLMKRLVTDMNVFVDDRLDWDSIQTSVSRFRDDSIEYLIGALSE